MLRGTLMGTTIPTSIPSIISSLSRESSVQGLLCCQLQELLDSNILQGTIQGGIKGTYTPSAYNNNRDKLIESDYNGNGVIHYSFLRKLSVVAPSQWLEKKFNNGKLYHSYYISAKYLSELQETVTASLLDGNLLLNLEQYLPSGSTERDYELFTNTLLDTMTDFHKTYRVITDSWIVHTTLLKVIEQKLHSFCNVTVSNFMKTWKPMIKSSTTTTTTKKKNRKHKEPLTSDKPKPEEIITEEDMVEIVFDSLTAHEKNVSSATAEESDYTLLSEGVYDLLSDSVSFTVHRRIDQLIDKVDSNCVKEEQSLDQLIQSAWICCNLIKAADECNYPKNLSRQQLLLEANLKLLTTITNLVLVQNGFSLSGLSHETKTVEELISILKELPDAHSEPIIKLLTHITTPSFLQMCEKERDRLGIFLKLPKPRELREMQKSTISTRLSTAHNSIQLLQISVGAAYSLYNKAFISSVPMSLVKETLSVLSNNEECDDLVIQLLISAYENIEVGGDAAQIEQSLSEVVVRLRELTKK